MRKLFLVILVSLFAVSAQAAFLNIMSPVQQRMGAYESVDLGIAGPGQTITLVVGRESDGTTIGYNPQAWDNVTPLDVPPGWEVEGAREYPMKVKIKIAPDAPNTIYNLTLMAKDEGKADGTGYDNIGNLTFFAAVTVSTDVINISVSPSQVMTGVGQPAAYMVAITNRGSASDPFQIRVKDGLSAWRYEKQVLVNYNSTRVVPYEVVLNEIGEKNFTLEVSSLSSPLIKQELPLSVVAEGDVLQDWRATTHGLMLFPILLEPLYAVMGLIGNLVGYIG